jgi:hypothetical protein
MQINISVQFMFDVPLTAQHVAALIKLSQHHYDHRCKEASSETGFLTVWLRMINNCTTLGLDVAPTRATWSELDTCLKLLETRRLAALLIGEADLCDDLNRAFAGALGLAGSKYHDWRAVYGASKATVD